VHGCASSHAVATKVHYCATFKRRGLRRVEMAD
jgi:hypothetical protein